MMRSGVHSSGVRVVSIAFSLALAPLVFPVPSGAQAIDQQPPFVLKQSVRLVIVPVTVKDRKSDLVDDLSQQDFRVFEDDLERPVRYFSTETMPLSAVVLLDTGMAAPPLGTVRTTVRSLSNAFAPDDEEALYLFDNTIRRAQDFTSHADLLAEAVDKARPEPAGPSLAGGPLGNSAPIINGVPVDRPGTFPSPARPVGKRLSDALYTAAQALKTRAPGRRRLVLIVSDGVNGSDNAFSDSEALEALETSDVTLYAISFGSGWALRRADLLARISRATGGDVAYVQRAKALDAAYFRLTNEARNSYVLGFAPASADVELHKIEVRVARPGVHPIARNRFLAPPAK